MNPTTTSLSTRNTILLSTVLAGVLIYLIYKLYVDFSLGGNSWKQGDWLINELSGPIRRGLFGSGLLKISDMAGLSPLLLLIAFQASVIVLIFAVIGIAAFKLGAPDKLLLLLLSPAFLIFFWFNDPQGSVRKEILVYLAFLPLVLAAVKGRGGIVACVFSCIFYAVAVIAHEGNVFFLPFLWIAMWLVLPPEPGVAARLLVIVVPGLLALGGGIYASAYTNFPDPGMICMQVVQRGLDPLVCDGAIEYLERPPHEARMHPGRLLSIHFRSFLLIYAACLISFRVLLQGSKSIERWFFYIAASGLVFLPLYILAGDYGRWMNFHITSLVFLTLILLLKWRPPWLYEMPRRLDFVCVLALSVVVGISHSPGEMIDGFFVQVVRAIYLALS